MRQKQEFVLYRRNRAGAKNFFYLRTYDKEGHPVTRSTGQVTKTAAHAFVMDLIKKGELSPKKEQPFGDFARDFFVWDKCLYLKGRIARGKRLSQRYADIARIYLVRHILPYFKDKMLTKITTADVEHWFLSLAEGGSLKHTTLNNIYATLRIIFNEAERLGLIYRNPMKGVLPLSRSAAEKGIFSIEEVKRLFTEESIPVLWHNNLVHYTLSRLCATGGLRIGEALALQNQYVHDSYIEVRHSLCRRYGLKSTKSGKPRYVPIPSFTAKYLLSLRGADPSGFIFSADGGESPMSYETVIKFFYAALQRAGITPEDRKERRLSLHSWRHFYISSMRTWIPEEVLKKIVGHAESLMVERYDHPSYNAELYQGAVLVQERLLKD